MVAPERAMPVGAVNVTVPPQTVAVEFGTVNPFGRVSVKLTPVSASAVFGLVIVNVSELVPLTAIVVGLNAFAIEGGAITVTLADAVPPVPPSTEVTLLVVLFFTPAVVPVTLIEKVQELFAAIVPPLKLTELLAGAAVINPAPQLPVNPLGVETTSPAGNVSVKPTPDNGSVALLF
jgi:hypothetical protein